MRSPNGEKIESSSEDGWSEKEKKRYLPVRWKMRARNKEGDKEMIEKIIEWECMRAGIMKWNYWRCDGEKYKLTASNQCLIEEEHWLNQVKSSQAVLRQCIGKTCKRLHNQPCPGSMIHEYASNITTDVVRIGCIWILIGTNLTHSSLAPDGAWTETLQTMITIQTIMK